MPERHLFIRKPNFIYAISFFIRLLLEEKLSAQQTDEVGM